MAITKLHFAKTTEFSVSYGIPRLMKLY